MNPVEIPPLTIRQAIPFFQQGAALLDIRSQDEYAQRHVPGGLHLLLDEHFADRLQDQLPPNMPLVLLVEKNQPLPEVVRQLSELGYAQIAGYLAEGLDVWEALGLPVAMGDVGEISPPELQHMLQSGEDILLLDVREPWEYQWRRVPGAVLIPLGELEARLGELDPLKPVVVICEHGHRSRYATMALAGRNFKRVYNLTGGTTHWVADGFPVERG